MNLKISGGGETLVMNKNHNSMNMSTSGVCAQGDRCTVTIFWSILHLHLLYSTCSTVPLTNTVSYIVDIFELFFNQDIVVKIS